MTKQTLIKLMTLLALSFGLTACGGGGSSTPNANNTTKPDDNNTPSVNHLPSITGTPTTTILKDNAYTFTPVVIDSDGDTLTFSIDKKPSWATFDTDTGKLSGTPSSTEDVGTTSGIVISVSDGIEEVELSAFSLTVKLVNHAPTISGTPSTSVNADKEYSFTPTATDVDTTDTLVFTIVNQPSWASFDTATGKLSGKPTNEHNGTTSSIVIAVNDGTVTTSLTRFNLTVNYVNHAPTISGTPSTSLDADSLYSFSPTHEDVDTTDTLTFSITNKPSWASFDTATGKLSGTPSNTNEGTTTDIVISVSDNKGGKAELPVFSIEVIFKIVDCRGKNQGFNNATIVTKKSIQGKNSNTKIRLWHTSDGVRKACVY